MPESTSLICLAGKIIYSVAGDTEKIEENALNDIASKTKVLTFADIINLPPVEKERLGLSHTPQEINQQPSTWRETFNLLNNIQPDVKRFLENSGLGSSSLTVSLIGAGTSDYIGRALAAILKKEWRCQVNVVPSTDMLTEMDDIVASSPDGTRHIWISFSRSGDSFEGVTVIQAALEKYPQINHLVVTCNKNGKMATELCVGRSNAFCITLDDKVNDRGLAMTSSFTNMVIIGQALANILDLDPYRPVVDTLAFVAENALTDIASLASIIAEQNYSRICFLGTGTLRAVGDESALKVMELTAGHYSVMSESFLGLRHGPLSWLNEDSLVVGFISNNIEKQKIEIGLLEELKNKNAAKSILAILPHENGEVSKYSDYQLILNIPDTLDDAYRPPVDILFAQCLGLFASLRRHLRPDAPSADGKIQRVVSQINGA